MNVSALPARDPYKTAKRSEKPPDACTPVVLKRSPAENTKGKDEKAHCGDTKPNKRSKITTSGEGGAEVKMKKSSRKGVTSAEKDQVKKPEKGGIVADGRIKPTKKKTLDGSKEDNKNHPRSRSKEPSAEGDKSRCQGRRNSKSHSSDEKNNNKVKRKSKERVSDGEKGGNLRLKRHTKENAEENDSARERRRAAMLKMTRTYTEEEDEDKNTKSKLKKIARRFMTTEEDDVRQSVQ
ncbi:hypothetical protein COOONC_19053 [Cooperia oncophora]